MIDKGLTSSQDFWSDMLSNKVKSKMMFNREYNVVFNVENKTETFSNVLVSADDSFLYFFDFVDNVNIIKIKDLVSMSSTDIAFTTSAPLMSILNLDSDGEMFNIRCKHCKSKKVGLDVYEQNNKRLTAHVVIKCMDCGSVKVTYLT